MNTPGSLEEGRAHRHASVSPGTASSPPEKEQALTEQFPLQEKPEVSL